MEPRARILTESAEFHLIMNVCGENPIMAPLHQAYRSGEAVAFKAVSVNWMRATVQIRSSVNLPSTRLKCVCGQRDKCIHTLQRKRPQLTFEHVHVSVFFFLFLVKRNKL